MQVALLPWRLVIFRTASERERVSSTTKPLSCSLPLTASLTHSSRAWGTGHSGTEWCCVAGIGHLCHVSGPHVWGLGCQLHQLSQSKQPHTHTSIATCIAQQQPHLRWKAEGKKTVRTSRGGPGKVDLIRNVYLGCHGEDSEGVQCCRDEGEGGIRR